MIDPRQNGEIMPKPDGFRSIHLHVPPQFYRKLKIAVAAKDTTLRDYIMLLVEDDLNKLTKKKIPGLGEEQL